MGEARTSAGAADPERDAVRDVDNIDLAREAGFSLGPLRFQPSTRQLFANGDSETLEPRVMQVVALLARHRGQVVSRDELVERCWEGRAVSEDAINRSIAKVRRIAQSRGGFELETIPRVGYRLTERGADAAAVPSKRRFRFALGAAALLLLVAAGVALWLMVLRGGPAEPEPVSVAVLPFRNLSQGDDYFAEGVAEEILTQLSRQPGLRVAGRTSSWMFQNADARDIGRRLDVAYVLEGSVRRSGRQVRVDVALVDTEDGMRLWSQAFEGSLDDIFAIQSQIGSMVMGRLRDQIVLAAPVADSLTTRGDVYNLYLTARALLRTREPAQVEAAAELLRRAVRLDPDYAPAWASLGLALDAKSLAIGLQPAAIRELRTEAGRSVERALRLAPDLAEAHAALAFLEPAGPDTRRRLERAVQLAPGNAEMWQSLAWARMTVLDFEGGLEALRRTAAIDPFWIEAAAYPELAWTMGDTQAAFDYERRLMRDHPEPLGRLMAQARMATYRRDWSEAYRIARQADRLRPQQVRAREFTPEPIFLRLRVNRLDEAAPLMSYPIVLDLARGAVPTRAQLIAAVESPEGFWVSSPVRNAALFRLNQHGQGAVILDLYDAVFTSPDALAREYVYAPAFLLRAGPVVVALRDAGRTREAERMLSLADSAVTRIFSRGRVPFELIMAAARIRALQGRREEALGLLERAVGMGWQWDGFPMTPLLAEDPQLRTIRNEPRLRRLDAIIQNAVARERRETQALPI